MSDAPGSPRQPYFSPEETARLRRYFAGLRAYNQLERDMVRTRPLDPEQSLRTFDELFQHAVETGTFDPWDDQPDDEAEARVASAFRRYQAARATRRSA